jgi:hypothetical protein
VKSSVSNRGSFVNAQGPRSGVLTAARAFRRRFRQEQGSRLSMRFGA